MLREGKWRFIRRKDQDRYFIIYRRYSRISRVKNEVTGNTRDFNCASALIINPSTSGNYEIGGIFLFCHRVSFNFHPSTIPERNLRLHTRPGVADACPTPKQESLRCNWNYAFIPMRRGGNFERTALLEAELLLLEGE